MLGFAVLTVLSLALMASRIHRRGRFGRKARAVLRSVYPFVLGLGGWFIGVLVALVALPTVPLDDRSSRRSRSARRSGSGSTTRGSTAACRPV